MPLTRNIAQELAQNFLNPTPAWYKLTILGFLLLNPILLLMAGPFVTGWMLIREFIFTSAMVYHSEHGNEWVDMIFGTKNWPLYAD